MKLRRATKSDKEQVLRFCINTFEWGDYIHQVWDLWYSHQDGLLLVVEEEEEEYSLHNKKQSSVIGVLKKAKIMNILLEENFKKKTKK